MGAWRLETQALPSPTGHPLGSLNAFRDIFFHFDWRLGHYQNRRVVIRHVRMMFVTVSVPLVLALLAGFNNALGFTTFGKTPDTPPPPVQPPPGRNPDHSLVQITKKNHHHTHFYIGHATLNNIKQRLISFNKTFNKNTLFFMNDVTLPIRFAWLYTSFYCSSLYWSSLQYNHPSIKLMLAIGQHIDISMWRCSYQLHFLSGSASRVRIYLVFGSTVRCYTPWKHGSNTI